MEPSFALPQVTVDTVCVVVVDVTTHHLDRQMAARLPSVTAAASSSLSPSISDATSSLETHSSKPSVTHRPQSGVSLLALAPPTPPKGVLAEQPSWVVQGSEVHSVAFNGIDQAGGVVLDKGWKSGIRFEGQLLAAAHVYTSLALAYRQTTGTSNKTLLTIYSVDSDPLDKSRQRDVRLECAVSALSFGKANVLYAGTSDGGIYTIVEDKPPAPLDCSSLDGHEIISMSYSHRIPEGLLIVATTHRVCIIRFGSDAEAAAAAKEPVWVGSRGHHGRFAAALLDDGRVCCARPGGRLWLADINLLDDSCDYATLSVQSTLKFSKNGRSISLGMLWVITDRHILSIGGSKNSVYLLDVETVEVAYDFGPLPNHHSGLPIIVTVSPIGRDPKQVLLHVGYHATSCITALVEAKVIGMPPDITLLSLSFSAQTSNPRSLPTRSAPPSAPAASNSNSSRRSKSRSVTDWRTSEGASDNGGIEVYNLSNFPRAIEDTKGARPIVSIGKLRHPTPASGDGSRIGGEPAAKLVSSASEQQQQQQTVELISASQGASLPTVSKSDIARVCLRARLLSMSPALWASASQETTTPSWAMEALAEEHHSLTNIAVIRDELQEVFTRLGWVEARRHLAGMPPKGSGDSQSSTALSSSRRGCDDFRRRWFGSMEGGYDERVCKYLQLLPHFVIHPRRDLDLLVNTPLQALDKYPAGLLILPEQSALPRALDTLRLCLPAVCPSGLLRYTDEQCHSSINCRCLAQRVLESVADHRQYLSRTVSSLGPLLPTFLLHTLATGHVDLLSDVLLAMEESSIDIGEDILLWLWDQAWRHQHCRDSAELTQSQ
ncbi:hypothetical protein FOZ62_030146 [Perkinsus olseni]|uniref:Uncharacterized protein n=2 Tax=Perkinsus olseni TaxID=32597 RepID=A0A7J6TMF5_PEROL|nr:hypothetical protein FOZ62_030146 [Perkinsus olseni]